MSDISQIHLPDGNTYNLKDTEGRKEENLEWGGTNQVGQVSPIGMALSNEHSVNRLAFINGDALTFEYSSDGGSTWTNYSYSSAEKSWFCTSVFPVPIGRPNGTADCTTSCRTRITLTAENGTTAYVYTNPRKMLINVSSANGMQVLVEYRTGTNYLNDGAWLTFGTYTLSGWSGWNDIPLILGTLGGGTTQYDNYWQLRLTFIITSITSSSEYANYSDVIGLRIYGENGWATTSNMGSTGHLYSYDASQNATFPANVYAASFIGNLIGGASTADKAYYLNGFSPSWSQAWGNQTGTFIHGEDDATGGSLAFRRDNPTSGQMSMIIDGTVYIKEGGQNVGDAIKSISRSGTTFTYTTLWGNTGTFTQQDSNTTYALSTSGNNVVLTPSSGSANTITVPYATNAGSATDSTKVAKVGDTVTGSINRESGGSWILARDNCVVKQTKQTQGIGSSWNPVVGIKTWAGHWSFGTVGGESLCLSYDTDSDYSNNNNTSKVIYFPSSGLEGTLALTSQIPTNNNQLTNGAGYITSSGSCAYATSAGSASPTSGSTYYIQNCTNSSRSTATSGSWIAMLNSSETGNPTLPTSSQWWTVLSADCWNSSPWNWMSQLAIATQDTNGVWWRRNDSADASIDSSTWHRLAEGDSDGNAVNANKVNNLTVQTAVPANAEFTDTKVTQTAIDGSSGDYYLLMSPKNSGNTETTTATKFKGLYFYNGYLIVGDGEEGDETTIGTTSRSTDIMNCRRAYMTEGSTCKGVELPHKYSETEQIVGYWIDNSPVYEITKYELSSGSGISVPALGTANLMDWTTPIQPISFKGFRYVPTGTSRFYSCWEHMGAQWQASSNKLQCYNSANHARNINGFTMQYIKI